MAFSTFVISADQAYKDFCDLKLNKQGKKSATLENITGKSFSEALIHASTNPKYGKILFIELQVQCRKIPSSEHVVYINCSECQNPSSIYYILYIWAVREKKWI